MALIGKYQTADGKTWEFRKPHVGPVMRFNETIALAEAGRASLSDVWGASLAVVLDAVQRLDPAVTREQLADSLDDGDLREMQSAVMTLIRGKEPEPGKAVSP